MRTSPITMRRSTIVRITAVAVGIAGGLIVIAPPAEGATCSDVEAVFARGTGETPGLGITGRPFVSALTSALPDRSVTSYAVDYAANTAQTSAGPGATDLSEHLSSVASSCPDTLFVIGGYSQGATVTDIAIGIGFGTTTGTAIPAKLSDRVAAVVVFGNPLGMLGRTIAQSSSTYGSRAKEFCNTGDPICGGGASMAAHLTYASNGSTTKGAQFAADLVAKGSAGGSSGGTRPTTGSTTTPTTGTGTTCPTTSIGLSDLSDLSANLSGLSSSSRYASLISSLSTWLSQRRGTC